MEPGLPDVRSGQGRMDKGVQRVNVAEQQGQIVLKGNGQFIGRQRRTLTNFQFGGNLPQHAAGQPSVELPGEAGFVRRESYAAEKIDLKPLAALLGAPAIPGLEQGEPS